MPRKTSRALSVVWIALTLALAVVAGLAGARWMQEQAQRSTVRNTVVWISIDGLRGDYVRRGGLRFFERLLNEAATTDKLRPAFPSTTFPSHSAEATGVTADKHGITGNAFYDSGSGLLYNQPNDAALLQAEPIWLTAQRQGVQTAVFDWPLSFAQKGRVRTEIFLDRFDPGIPDEQRLERVLDGWKSTIEKPSSVALHLVMGYIVATDKPGHVYGPDSMEIVRELTAVDAALADFCTRAIEIWKQQRHTPNDRLFFVFSTDHGMSPMRVIVSFDRLLGLAPNSPDYHLTTTGNVGHIFLNSKKYPPDSDAREAKLRELQQRVISTVPDFRAYLRHEIPTKFGYSHPTRTGDLVVILPSGYAFGVPESGELLVDISARPTYVRGMHGYDVDSDPNMLGFLAIWEPARPAAVDLGTVSWDQLHPTVAKLLGIRPAAGATGAPLPNPAAD